MTLSVFFALEGLIALGMMLGLRGAGHSFRQDRD